MADPKGFLTIRERELPGERPVAERIRDYREVHGLLPLSVVSDQASRCMDCGTPFCHMGCPLGNVIPDWNTHSWRGGTGIRASSASTRRTTSPSSPGGCARRRASPRASSGAIRNR